MSLSTLDFAMSSSPVAPMTMMGRWAIHADTPSYSSVHRNGGFDPIGKSDGVPGGIASQ